MGRVKHEGRNTRVRRKLREYFAHCQQAGRRYTLSGLRTALGSDGKDWEALTADPQLGPDVELAVMRIMDELEQRGDAMALLLRKEMGQTLRRTGAAATPGTARPPRATPPPWACPPGRW